MSKEPELRHLNEEEKETMKEKIMIAIAGCVGTIEEMPEGVIIENTIFNSDIQEVFMSAIFNFYSEKFMRNQINDLLKKIIGIEKQIPNRIEVLQHMTTYTVNKSIAQAIDKYKKSLEKKEKEPAADENTTA